MLRQIVSVVSVILFFPRKLAVCHYATILKNIVIIINYAYTITCNVHSSHLSASTLRSVPALIVTCQCFLSSAISVVLWFLAISSFTRSRHLSFGLPRFRFSSTVICNIFLVASSLSCICTYMSKPSSLWRILPSGTSVPLHFSHDLVLFSSWPPQHANFSYKYEISSPPSFLLPYILHRQHNIIRHIIMLKVRSTLEEIGFFWIEETWFKPLSRRNSQLWSISILLYSINRRLTTITSYLHFLSKWVFFDFGFFQFHSNVSASLA